MTDSRGVAAVTLGIRQLLLAGVPERDPGLSDLQVTTLSPDQARRGVTAAQINLFLYQVAPNAAWRGFDARAGAGEPGVPPLALDLRYLLTAWGRGEADGGAIGHRALGAALAVLHDAGGLDAAVLEAAFAPEPPLSPFVERVKLSPVPLGIEDLSKLWTAFQAGYRISAGCEATVVLIESARARRVAPPVLRRGPEDTGPRAFAEPAPVLDALVPPGERPSAEPGEAVRVRGRGLGGDLRLELVPLGGGAAVLLPLQEEPGPVAGARRPGDERFAATLDAPGAAWRAGFWTARLVRPLGGGRAWTSGARTLAVAPRIRALSSLVAGTALEVTVDATPRLGPGQRAELALPTEVVAEASRADAQVTPPGAPAPLDATRLVFRMDPPPAPGSYLVRLRVDGVESRSDRPQGGTGAPEPDPAQVLVVP